MLHLGVNPRNCALGNAGGSLLQNGEVFLSNPANLSYLRMPEFAGMYVSQFGMANYNILGISTPISEKLAIGIHWLHFGVDDIPLRPDLSGLNILTQRDSARTLLDHPLGMFTDREDALFISVARMFRWELDYGWQYASLPVETPVGINLKILNRKLYNITGTGIGLDLSFGLKFKLTDLLDADWMGKFGMAFLWQDITNTPISWSTYSQDMMPSNMQMFLSYVQPLPFIKSRLNFVYSGAKRFKGGRAFGVEYQFRQILGMQIGFRDHRMNAGISLNTHISAFPVSIQYAFSPHVLGNSHRVGLRISI